MNLSINIILEISAVAFSILYLIFAIREHYICWIFGMIGALISIWLFYRIGLFSESILYIYYLLIGYYGFYIWRKKEPKNAPLVISKWNIKNHFIVIGIGLFGGYGLGSLLSHYTVAQNAYFDAYTTIYSFITSYMEAQKILSSWLFWIVINAATLFLYIQKSLFIYATLTFAYFIFSFIGYIEWRKKAIA